jgi:hypothetical protein
LEEESAALPNINMKQADAEINGAMDTVSEGDCDTDRKNLHASADGANKAPEHRVENDPQNPKLASNVSTQESVVISTSKKKRRISITINGDLPRPTSSQQEPESDSEFSETLFAEMIKSIIFQDMDRPTVKLTMFSNMYSCQNCSEM